MKAELRLSPCEASMTPGVARRGWRGLTAPDSTRPVYSASAAVFLPDSYCRDPIYQSELQLRGSATIHHETKFKRMLLTGGDTYLARDVLSASPSWP